MDKKLIPASVEDPVLVWVMCGRIEHPALILNAVDEHQVHVRWQSNGTEGIVHLANVRYDTGGRGRKRRQQSTTKKSSTAAAAAVTNDDDDDVADDDAQKREATFQSRQELRRARKRRKQDMLLLSKHHQQQQQQVLVKHQSAAAPTAVVDSRLHHKVVQDSLLKTKQQEKRIPQQGYYPDDSSDDDDDDEEIVLPRRQKGVTPPRKRKYIGDDDDEDEDSSDDEVPKNDKNKKGGIMMAIPRRGTTPGMEKEFGEPKNGHDNTTKNVAEQRSAGISFPSKNEPKPFEKDKRNDPHGSVDDADNDEKRATSHHHHHQRKSNIHADVDSSDDEIFNSNLQESTLGRVNGVKHTLSEKYSTCTSARWEESHPEKKQDSKKCNDSSAEDIQPHHAELRTITRPDARMTNCDASVFEKDTDNETCYHEATKGHRGLSGIGEVSVFDKDTEDDGSSEPGIRDEYRDDAADRDLFERQKPSSKTPVKRNRMQPRDASRIENQSVHRAVGPLLNDPRVARKAGNIDSDSASTSSVIRRKTANLKASEEEIASDEIDRLLHESNREYFMYRNFPFIDAPEPLDPKKTLDVTKKQFGSVELLSLLKMKMCGKCETRLGIYFHMFCSEQKLMGTSCSLCHFNIKQPLNAPFHFSQPAWTANLAEKALKLPGLKDYLMSNYRDNALELPNGALVFKDENVTACAIEICGSVWDFHRAVAVHLKKHVDPAPKRSAQQSIKPASNQSTLQQTVELTSERSVHKSIKAALKEPPPQQSTKPPPGPSAQKSMKPPPKLSMQQSTISAADISVQKITKAATASSVQQVIESVPNESLHQSSIKPALKGWEQHNSAGVCGETIR